MKKILLAIALALLPGLLHAQSYDGSGRLRVNAFQGAGAGAATSFWNFRLTDGANFIPMPLALGGAGGLKIECLSGCGGAAAFADAAAFTFGTTPVGVFAAVVDDVATNTVAENSAGAPRMSTNRVLYVDLSKSAANTSAFLITGTGGTFPVTGTFWQATQPVSGTFWQATQPVSGTVTVTDGAGALNVIVDSGSLTANAGTNLNTSALNLEATQALVKVKTDNLDVALSTRLKPADTLTAVTTVGTITNPVSVQPTATASSLNDGACVSVTTTSGTVVASNASRKFLALYSRSTNTDLVYLRLAATATTADFPLEVGQPFNITGDWIYTGVIDARSAAGTQSVCFVEF